MATLIGEPVIRHVGASLETEIAGQHMELLPEKALYWPRERTLFVADLHLGKAAHFRAEAVPVPMGTTRENLSRLARLLKRTGAERLVILGDLWHSQQALAPATLELVHAWRTKYSSLEAVLVMGNHDAKLDAIPKAFALRVEDEGVAMGPFELRHHPSDSGSGAYRLAGHIHPSVTLEGKGRDSLRLPCFWFGESQGVLPAFGELTGTARVHPRPSDRVFVVAGSRVMAVS